MIFFISSSLSRTISFKTHKNHLRVASSLQTLQSIFNSNKKAGSLAALALLVP